VAEKLAKAQPGWEYANLAIRSKRLRHIIAEQLGPALAMEPTLITLYAGGNDILDFGTDIEALMQDYESLVAALAGSGATVVLFTGFDVKVSALLEPLKKRNAIYNQRVRAIAGRYGAVLVDYWCFDAFHDARMWDSDRLHMSKAGHKYLAAQVLDHLGVPHTFQPKEWEPPVKPGLREWERRQRRWMHDWVLPLFGRKLRGVTLGDSLRPRWPEPVKVPRKRGLKKLLQAQRAGG
jgi:lysophospholipase L1-like esterase